ncbi:MAG: hypothetical protein POELPBGB_02079 [Bacteroidia bacterium]|nr:hypothetical protein [Bacteroidia bacterium]
MSNQKTSDSLYNKIINRTGWDLSLVKKENCKEAPTPFQRNIAQEILLSNESVSADEIYFSGEQPFIHIKHLRLIDGKKIRELHSKIWNEGRSPFLAAITPTEMRLYNCYEPPVENDEELEQQLQLGKFEDTESDLNELVQFLHQSKIDSGKVWEEKFGQKINIRNRVDKKLVANLKATRANLYNNGKDLSLPVVHALLGRALFIYYLEDRNILTTDAYPKKPRGVESFSDLLSYKDETYELFENLKEKFNGDLFPISKAERQHVKSKHLEEVKRCFNTLDYTTGQLSFKEWKVFRFDFIPIELISSIYEEFMSAEEEENGKTTIRDNGAYYTKPMLVEFMLNEVLPWPDERDNRYDYKILDPACGSGIFLVESYRRLIARWKLAKNKKKIDKDSLANILLNSIYGIDKHPEAIKVAAFSLYLTFLNYLEPVEIRNEYIRLKSKKFKPLIRWSDEAELEERTNKDVGNNLFQFNTFADSDIRQIKFDIIIGNPPWKKDKPEPIVAAYIETHKLPSQIACAYMDDMPRLLAPNGVIALVTTAKILFNTGDGYEKFRQKIFENYDVDIVVNLAVVRNVMFENTTNPGVVIVYRNKNTDKKIKPYVVYCVPKNIQTIDNRQSIVIDGTEVKYLPLKEIQKGNSKIFKIAMWGGMRDYLLLKRLQEISSILKIFKDADKGIGLHSKGVDDETLSSTFKNYKLIPQNRIERYYTPNVKFNELGNDYLKYRKLNEGIFKPPLILLKRGTTDMDICSSFIDYKGVFTDRIYGLSIKDRSLEYQKALVACLNSKMAMYYLFMISSTWSVDKGGDMLHKEILSFPAIPEAMKEKAIETLAMKVDSIIQIKAGDNLVMNPDKEIEKIELEINEIIYKELRIGKQEQNLINDVLNNSIALTGRYKESGAVEMANVNTHVKHYAQVLSKTLNQTLIHGNSRVWTEVLDNERKEPLHIITIHFNGDQEPGSALIEKVDANKFSKLVKKINQHVLSQHSESIYYRKVFRYYKDKKIYLVKPNEKRFWTVSEALNDADSILAELINANN